MKLLRKTPIYQTNISKKYNYKLQIFSPYVKDLIVKCQNLSSEEESIFSINESIDIKNDDM